MHGVMIVEDELLVRIGLRNGIDWKKFGMTVIAEESDGKSAIDSYERYHPDLIITDIKMPIMDGMSLIEHIREKDEDSKIIILTCVEEFETARAAVKLGVNDYILKLTMTFEEMEEVIGKAKKELDEQATMVQKFSSMTQASDVVRRKIIKEYLLNETYDREAFVKEVKEYPLPFKPERLRVCVMEIDNYMLLQSSSTSSVVSEVIKQYQGCEFIQIDKHRYVLITSFPNLLSEQACYEALYTILKRVNKIIHNYFNRSVSIGISSIKNGYGIMRDLYDEAARALELKYFLGLGKIMTWNETNRQQAIHIKNQKMEDWYRFIQDNTYMSKTQKSKYTKLIDECRINEVIVRDDITRLCNQIMYLHSIDFSQVGISGFELLMKYREYLNYSETLGDLIDVIITTTEEFCNKAIKGRVVSKELAQAIKYIKDNYRNPISLEQVAGQVNLSPNYLSYLFKKELDYNFIEYLNYMRIERAKELVVDSNMKLYEIANEVGFTDGSYFSRMFKKLTGMQPSEFKKQYVLDGIGGNL